MEYTLGKMDGAIREIFKMIIEMDMENYILMKENQFHKVIGKMDNRLMDKILI